MKLKSLWIKFRSIPKDKRAACLLGIGLVISVIHNPNQPLIDWLFLPIAGNIIIIVVSLEYVIDMIKIKQLDLGSRWVYIPMMVIVASTFLRACYGFIFSDSNDILKEFAMFGYSIGLFCLYLTSRKLGKEIFKPFVYGVVIVTLSLIYAHIINPGVKTGGIISPTNYDIATGFLVFGAFVSVFKRQWIIVAIALVGLLLTGADEALFSIFVMGMFILFREVIHISRKGVSINFNSKVQVITGVIALFAILAVVTGIAEGLYQPAIDKVQALFGGDLYAATNERLGTGGNLDIFPLKIFGNGYFINWDDSYRLQIPHNVPIIIVDQIGIGALAWCVIAGYCLIKTRMKYAWVALLSLCVFDHYIWTQAAPYFPALVGVSTINSDKDYTFTEIE